MGSPSSEAIHFTLRIQILSSKMGKLCFAAIWYAIVLSGILQADQLTEEQIAGKTWLHWSTTFPHVLQSGFCYGSLAFLAVDLYFCLLRHSTGQPAGHKTGMNETAVACWLWRVEGTPSRKTSRFHDHHVINDVIWKGRDYCSRCWS